MSYEHRAFTDRVGSEGGRRREKEWQTERHRMRRHPRHHSKMVDYSNICGFLSPDFPNRKLDPFLLYLLYLRPQLEGREEGWGGGGGGE